MYARLIVIAATLAIGTAAAAAPPKPQAAAAPATSKPVVLASADTVNTNPVATDGQAPAPVKRRAARVTSCRCGDPQPETQNQQ